MKLIEEPKLLRPVAEIRVPGAKRFVASEHLKAVNVGDTRGEFGRSFLNKIEKDVPDITVVVHRLENHSNDAWIRGCLGDHTEIQLAHFFGLLEKQSQGGEGLLLTDGLKWNMAYVLGLGGDPAVMDSIWDGGNDSWILSACSVGYLRHLAGDQIFSREA